MRDDILANVTQPGVNNCIYLENRIAKRLGIACNKSQSEMSREDIYWTSIFFMPSAIIFSTQIAPTYLSSPLCTTIAAALEIFHRG